VFVLYALLGEDSPAFTQDTVARRIRVVFGDDDGRDFTSEAIEVTGFLTAIPGAVVFDPQQNDLVGP
jgi:hypothetical protein